MMNHLLSSESSSGCESGWTIYLQQSNLYFSNSHPTPLTNSRYDDDEDDSSMLSDASSAPPHFLNQEYHLQNHIDSSRRKVEKTNKYRSPEVQQQLCLLDDTASSPLSNFSTSNLALGNNQDEMECASDFSQAHSSTHYKRKSVLKEHFTLFQPSFCFCNPTATKPVV